MTELVLYFAGGAIVLAAGVWVLVGRRGPSVVKAPPARELLKELPPELAGRYLELVGVRDRVRKTVKEHGLEPVMGDQLGNLDRLVDGYLRLAQDVSRYRAYLLTSPPGALEKELERTRVRLEGTAAPDVKATIAQNIAVLEKRLERLGQIRDVSAGLKTQLDILEDAIYLIHEQALTASTPADIRVDFGQLLDEVAAAEAAVAETRALVGVTRNTGSLR